MKKNKTALSWMFVSVLIIAIDQLTKYLIYSHFTQKTVVYVCQFLNLIMRFNAGAAFSFLGDATGWQVYLLSGVSITVSLVLLIWLARLPRSAFWTALPVSLILGGAIGNLIDRVRFGYVIDFLDFHARGWHYATFNVADSAVSIGAAWLIVRLLYESFARQP